MQQVSQQQHRPALADQIQRARHWTIINSIAPTHCDCNL